MNSPITEQTDEEIQAELAGETVRGPRAFRGQTLAPLSRGLRDLHRKVLRPDDSDVFHDITLMLILSKAHAAEEAKKLEQRAQLIRETDAPLLFRAQVSVILDSISDAEEAEARRLTDEMLGLVSRAQVNVVQKKSQDDLPPGELSPTTTQSPPGPSPEPPAGAPTSSAGN